MNKPHYKAWYGKMPRPTANDVEVVLRNGAILKCLTIDCDWGHANRAIDIIAYRELPK